MQPEAPHRGNQKSLVNSVILPSTIGYFTTIPNKPKRNTLKKRQKYLEKFHMDIVFGDCVVLGRNHYALLLFDVETIYFWLYI